MVSVCLYFLLHTHIILGLTLDILVIQQASFFSFRCFLTFFFYLVKAPREQWLDSSKLRTQTCQLLNYFDWACAFLHLLSFTFIASFLQRISNYPYPRRHSWQLGYLLIRGPLIIRVWRNYSFLINKNFFKTKFDFYYPTQKLHN